MSEAELIIQTLRGMLIGIPGVFVVLAIFYVVLRFMMSKTDREYRESHKQEKSEK